MFGNPLTAKLTGFVRNIGIEVRDADLPEQTFLPGLDIRFGALLVDEERLLYPGDVLHEAGHIAVASPEERSRKTLKPRGGGEIAAIAWSYAAGSTDPGSRDRPAPSRIRPAGCRAAPTA
jgi:hypothetical protein